MKYFSYANENVSKNYAYLINEIDVSGHRQVQLAQCWFYIVSLATTISRRDIDFLEFLLEAYSLLLSPLFLMESVCVYLSYLKGWAGRVKAFEQTSQWRFSNPI